MSDPYHLSILKSGVEEWNTWRRKNKYPLPNLEEVYLGGDDLSKADLSNAYLRGANLAGADLSYADLSNANLEGANLAGANLSHANLKSADLSSVNLTVANLVSANFSHTNLYDARMARANFEHAQIIDARFTFANLSGAKFHSTLCESTDFFGADFRGARLQGTAFYNCLISDADFSHCTLGDCTFADIDLQRVKGLDLIKHIYPSSIGIDTIYRSDGKIPAAFLRKCGVPEEFITYAPSLVSAQQGFQFHSCFISYSSKDEGFAKCLHSKMREENLRVWFAPEDIRAGKKIYDQIESAIHIHDRLLLVISEESMQSEWVFTEIKNAFREEKKHGRRKLFPIRLVDFDKIKEWRLIDSDWGKDLAAEIRSYHIPDFSNWKDEDVFESAFSRLLRDLKAEEKNG